MDLQTNVPATSNNTSVNNGSKKPEAEAFVNLKLTLADGSTVTLRTQYAVTVISNSKINKGAIEATKAEGGRKVFKGELELVLNEPKDYDVSDLTFA